MKRSLNTLKTYFETGDVPTQAQYVDVFDSLVHKDDAVIPYTVFVDNQQGDDTTAILGSAQQCFQTIDAAIATYNTKFPKPATATSLQHQYLHIILLAEGTYEINVQLPQRNLRFESKEVCTIDFSNNTNEYLNEQTLSDLYSYSFYVPKGTIYNNSTHIFEDANLYFEAELDTIEVYGAAYTAFGRGFVSAHQINANCKVIKGNGIIFSSLGTNSVNSVKASIKSANKKLVINNEGNGTHFFDFDLVTGNYEVVLLKSGLSSQAHINFGTFQTTVESSIASVANTGKIFVNFKENAETYGTFSAGEVHLTGKEVTVNAPLARVQNKLFITNVSLKSTTHLCSLIHGDAKLYVNNSSIEVPEHIVYIETNTNFSGDCIIFKGQNSILQTSTPESDLVTKFSTALPTNVNYRVELQNSLLTNGVLNTTIVGNTNTTATLNVGSTNSY